MCHRPQVDNLINPQHLGVAAVLWNRGADCLDPAGFLEMWNKNQS